MSIFSGFGNIVNKVSDLIAKSDVQPHIKDDGNIQPASKIKIDPTIAPAPFVIKLIPSEAARSFEFGGTNSRTAYLNSDRRDIRLTSILRFDEIRLMITTESLVFQSVDKYVDTIVRKGWYLKGSNKDSVDYIYRRISEIAIASGVSFESILRDLVFDLVTYANGFIVFKRDTNRSSGRMYKKGLQPISAISTLPPITLTATVDSFGTPVAWIQNNVNGSEYTFNTEDVVQFSVFRNGSYFGTPFITSVLDDVTALRGLEQFALLQSFSCAVPLIHGKVGSADRPSSLYRTEDGGTVIGELRTALENAAHDGVIATSFDVDIEAINTGTPLDILKYLSYFEQRVIAGLGMSGVLLGQGDTANRGTAQVQESQLIDKATKYQNVIESEITFKLIHQLLLESGKAGEPSFDPYADQVLFKFVEVDEETTRARENHIGNLFNLNLLDINEARTRMGQLPVDNKILSLMSYYLFPKNQSDASGLVANNEEPTNQHGTQASKPKYKKDEILKAKFLDTIVATMDDINKGISDGILTEQSVTTIVSLTRDSLKTTLDTVVEQLAVDFILYVKSIDGPIVDIDELKYKNISEECFTYFVEPIVCDLRESALALIALPQQTQKRAKHKVIKDLVSNRVNRTVDGISDIIFNRFSEIAKLDSIIINAGA